MVNFILGGVLPLILIIAAGYLLKLYRDENVIKWVKVAVKAAEQIYASGQGQEKFTYVAEWISEKFNISEADLKNLIESAVYEINRDEGESKYGI